MRRIVYAAAITFVALAGPLAATVPAFAVVLVNQPASSVCVGKHSRSEYGISNSLEVHGRIALPCMTPAGGAFSTNRARLLPRSGGSGESARSTRGNTTPCTKPAPTADGFDIELSP